MQIGDIHFMQNIYLYFFFSVPIILYFYIKLEKNRAINIGIISDIKQVYGKYNYFLYIKVIIITFILSLFILLLADPHKSNIKQNITKNGIDIVIALDISKSMEATDLKPTRIEKAIDVISGFIDKQKTNRVGLIVFAGKPLSSIPLTFDYSILIETLKNTNTDSLNQNVSGLEGTAVGDALLLGKNLFEKEDKREKVIILLTDGDANTGVDPVIASKLLGEENIKIYPIGIGSKQGGNIKINNGFFTRNATIPPLNVKPLKQIANNTNGYFFRATDNETIEKIFNKLEELEKNDIEVEVVKSFTQYYSLFIYLLMLCLSSLLFLEIKRVKN